MRIILNPKKFAHRAIGLVWVLVAILVLMFGIWVVVWIWRLAQIPPRQLPDENQTQNHRGVSPPPTNYFRVEDI